MYPVHTETPAPGMLPSAFPGVYFALDKGERPPAPLRVTDPRDDPLRAKVRAMQPIDWIAKIDKEDMDPRFAMSEIIRTHDNPRWLERIAEKNKEAGQWLQGHMEGRHDPVPEPGKGGFLAAIMRGVETAAAKSLHMPRPH